MIDVMRILPFEENSRETTGTSSTSFQSDGPTRVLVVVDRHTDTRLVG